MIISIAKSVSAGMTLKNLTWSVFAEMFKTPVRTKETVEEFKTLSKKAQTRIKDVGCFLGGESKDGCHKVESIVNRTLLALDLDNCDGTVYDKIDKACSGLNYVLYSTHKHTPEAPRLRILFPFSRPIDPDQYEAIGRQVTSDIGIDLFDDTTYQLNRVMFFPSCSSDGEYVYKNNVGKDLDPDDYLSRYTDWKDAMSWPISEAQKAKGYRPSMASDRKMSDPRTKPGVIGAFCSVYTIEDAIDKFLPDIYEPAGIPGRYTYRKASTYAGLVCYDHLFAYSHHNSDPAQGRTLNAFDLVRIHKFSHLDPGGGGTGSLDNPFYGPSYKAMQKFAAADPHVKDYMMTEALSYMTSEDGEEPGEAVSGEWVSELECDKKGNPKNVLPNFSLIFANDPVLQKIKYNAFTNRFILTGKMPWQRPFSDANLNSADMCCIRDYIAKTYNGLYHKQITDDALGMLKHLRGFHQVRDYLSGLVWDGEPRLDNLLIDYLGAPDTPYTQAVTRKTLVAAVKRIFEPGCKFDNMLVLQGKQGLGKSQLFHKLAGKWFSDSLSMNDMTDKTAPEKLQGFWIMEIAELQGMKKSDVEIVKGFLTRQDDAYRNAYGEMVESHLRQCIVVGTTNAENGFLRDATGNRRFWPVTVSLKPGAKTPWDLTQEIVDQIWAEAVTWYNRGETLYLSGDVLVRAEDEQRAALESDDREGLVREFLDQPLPKDWNSKGVYERQNYWMQDAHLRSGTEPRTTICGLEIWCECFGKRQADYKRIEGNQIRLIMGRIDGWEYAGTTSKKRMGPYGPQFYWRRVAPVPPAPDTSTETNTTFSEGSEGLFEII